MPVYVIAQIKIHDPEGYKKYEEGFIPIFMQYGGTFLGLSEDPEILEGEWPFTRAVLISFETAEKARAWMNSPEYQEIAKHRHAASTGTVMMIPGFSLEDAQAPA